VGMMVSTGYLPEDVLDMSIKDEIKIEKPVKATPFAAQAPSDSPAAAAAEVAAVTSSEQAATAAAAAVPLSISPVNADVQMISSVAASNNNSPKGGYHHHHHHHRRVFSLSILNLVDPFQVDHNILESIDAPDCDLIVSVFLEAYKHLQVICQTMVKTEQSLENEATKVMKLLFPNTIARYGTVPTAAVVHDSSGDVLLAAKQDMQFAWCYGSIAMSGKIDLATLIQVVLIVLDKKGPMPVGEIGKNLALIFGCDNLSRRLKEQFTGLKRAIENANSTTRLKVGTEHQFNPVVSLIGEGSVLPDIADSLWCFHHAAFLFTPFSINLQMQQQALKDSQARAAQQMMQAPFYPQPGYNNNATRFNNNSYARRPYTYAGNNHVNMMSDTMSISSISTTNTDRRGPYVGGAEGYGHHLAYSPGGRGGHGGQMRSPTRPIANSNNMQQMMPPPMPIMQMPYDPATGQPFYPPPLAMFAPAVPMGAMYQQHPMAMSPYHGYYHNSMASSLGSSYGGPGMLGGNGSPISQSPSTNSYMQPPPPQVLMQMMPPLLPNNNDSQQQQQPRYPPQDEGN